MASILPKIFSESDNTVLECYQDALDEALLEAGAIQAEPTLPQRVKGQQEELLAGIERRVGVQAELEQR